MVAGLLRVEVARFRVEVVAGLLRVVVAAAARQLLVAEEEEDSLDGVEFHDHVCPSPYPFYACP